MLLVNQLMIYPLYTSFHYFLLHFYIHYVITSQCLTVRHYMHRLLFLYKINERKKYYNNDYDRYTSFRKNDKVNISVQKSVCKLKEDYYYE